MSEFVSITRMNAEMLVATRADGGRVVIETDNPLFKAVDTGALGPVEDYVEPVVPYTVRLERWRQQAFCDAMAFQDELDDLDLLDNADAAVENIHAGFARRWFRAGGAMRRSNPYLVQLAGVLSEDADAFLDSLSVWAPAKPEAEE